jgi:acyl-coenzyme A synthetase/AMP-(fatty) acid ligase
MLKIQGNRVYPAEIREAMLGMEGVGQVEIVPVKSGDVMKVAAFVILRAGAQQTAAGLRMAMMGRAPSYMVPDTIVIKESFPRTASGKPDRQMLSAELV